MDTQNTNGPLHARLPYAESLLSRSWGEAVRLEPGPNLDGRAGVARCTVQTSVGGAPTTVVVKCGTGQEGRPYDPTNLDPSGPTARFLRDWLGLQLLDTMGNGAPIAPRGYVIDREHGLFVMEDLGSGESLADLLLAQDAARAEAGLLAYAETLGRMQAATLNQTDRYDELCRDLGVTLEPTMLPAQPSGDGPSRITGWCQAIGVAISPGTEDDLAAAFAHMASPGPFLAYTHGDPCPDNNRVTATGVRLFDFEHGAFRHALRDGAYGRLPFPTCWCANRLPSDLPARMEDAYRAVLASACPAAADETVFREHAMAAHASWLLTTLEWSLDEALTADQTWGISTLRQRCVLRLHIFADTAEEQSLLTALGRTARAMALRLQDEWGAGVPAMPLYPAFR